MTYERRQRLRDAATKAQTKCERLQTIYREQAIHAGYAADGMGYIANHANDFLDSPTIDCATNSLQQFQSFVQ